MPPDVLIKKEFHETNSNNPINMKQENVLVNNGATINEIFPNTQNQTPANNIFQNQVPSSLNNNFQNQQILNQQYPNTNIGIVKNNQMMYNNTNDNNRI